MNQGKRQWHLPFQSALQITLEKDEGYYELYPEVELTRKPFRIDYLILRVQDAGKMKSRFGKLLKNLSDCVSKEDFEQMAEQAYYRPEDKKRDELFQFIGENNKCLWQEGEKDMCKIFEEIEERGTTKGERRGEDRFSNLMKILLKEKRYKEIEIVSGDRKALHEMYKRYGI